MTNAIFAGTISLASPNFQKADIATKSTQPANEPVRFSKKVIAREIATKLNDSSASLKLPTDEISADKLYPHFYDPETEIGAAIKSIERALDDARKALEEFSLGRVTDLNTYLGNIAVRLKRSHSSISDNRSLAGVVAYARRAVLNTPADQITFEALSVLASTLASLVRAPAINLADGGELIENLEEHGWMGELLATSQLIDALTKNGLDVDEEVQQALFDI